MTAGMDPLDRLTADVEWTGSWEDVLRRAGASTTSTPARRRVWTPRRAVVVIALVLAVLAPVVALGAASDWSFLRDVNAPTPQHEPVVVKQGEWNGRRWGLVAYASTTDGVCFVVGYPGVPTSADFGGGWACAPIVGVPRTGETKRSPDMTVTYMGSFGSDGFGFVAGPVVASAERVEVRFRDGHVLRLPTFPAPASVGRVRFYATPLSARLAAAARRPGGHVREIRGVDARGDVVACLVPETAVDGVSPLADCR